MLIKHFLFDLDDTLYPPNAGLWSVLRDRIYDYMHSRVGIPAEQVEGLREHYYTTYGTSLRGLQIHHGVDASAYLDYVHNVPIEEYIQPNRTLDELLESIHIEKTIFTNSSRAHAMRVLQVLGISRHFTGIIDVQDIAPHCKPEPEAFLKAMAIIGDVDPSGYLLVDDSLRNIRAAMDLGIHAILVAPQVINNDQILQVPDIEHLPPVLAEMGLQA